MRALSALRLSVLTDETTSPERQRAACESAADTIGATIIGEAVDLGVSASKTTPFERPELGAWLNERTDEFDAVVWWRFDRAVRSMADMNELVAWAQQRRKMLVFAEGPGGRLVLDFRSGVDIVTRLLLQVFAFAAEFEAQSIRDRVVSAQAAMRVMPLRWRGSRPPYGYEPAPMAEGGGWTLVPDAGAVATIERIVKALSDGATVSAIAASLNADGVPSPRDHWSLRQGRQTGAFKWTPQVLTRLLRNPSLIGWKTSGGNPVRDAEGAPVMATNTPILTRSEFDAVAALLDARSVKNRPRRDTQALLLGIIHCAGCKGRMYLNVQRDQAPVYKCNSHARGEVCSAPSNVRGDWADDFVEREFLSAVGGLLVTHSRVVPGYDPQPEIDATAAEYEAHLASEGTQTNPVTRKLWEARRDALDARITALLAAEPRPERVEITDTGRSYVDEWHAADTAGKRALLLEAGARLRVTRGTRGGWRRLDESRVRFTLADEWFSDAALETAGVDL